ncbi:Site-specific recombinase XerD [Dyadobacter soli]|uniref:Site-specific recombinase XerD n=1 Tax=Dyadobacter soli TaxID=659014 RepID=A0A1G7B1S0_9BACT|nr:phage integrase SAM-like domain-containing protein [Dyadobacter soli]SDE21074.1 Site-specific recombinase XerD [Dyadobacter soli]
MNVYVNFFLRGGQSAAKDRKCAIYAEIHVEQTKATAFSTKLKVPPAYWMVSRNRTGIKPSTSDLPVSKSYPFSETLNEKLIAIKQFIIAAARDLELMDIEVSADRVKAQFFNPRPAIQTVNFLDVLDELRSVLGKKRKGSTMLTYRTRRNNIHEFLSANRLDSMKIHEFQYHDFEMLQAWMIDQRVTCKKSKTQVRRWGTNTINKHLTLINKVLNYGVNKKYLQYNPIGELGLEYEDTKPPQYLLPEARQRIANCELTTLEKERDVAVFLMHTGLSYTDYITLEEDHVLRLPSGEPFIKKPRDKSEIYSIVPLMHEAHAVIAKYGGICHLPRPDISDLNKALKMLGEVAKSPYSLSTSTFRETFSSMMENEFMVPDRLLMFMMGHTNPRQLRNYSRVMPARILHELRKHDIVIPFNLAAFESLFKAS